MKNTTRFSNRVDDYIKYRPHYPKGIIKILENKIGLNNDFIIADIGSGTGISSIPFLEKGNSVFGVEPNLEMRKGAEKFHEFKSKFQNIKGSAECTNLPTNSIDLIFCGQAFHWFDFDKSKEEFNRILRPNGRVVLCWNQRDVKSEFLEQYEQLLRTSITEYSKINHRNISDERIADFLYPKKMTLHQLDNAQYFNFEGLKGRLKSSSYCPKSGKEYDYLMIKLKKLFDEYQLDGNVKFDYKTQIYIG